MFDSEKKSGKLIIKSLGIFLTVVISLIFLILYFPPKFITDYLAKETEKRISQITGLDTKLGEISQLRIGIFEQTVRAENLKIGKSNKKDAEELLYTEKIILNFNLLKFLLSGNLESSALRIKISKPRIDLQRLKNGKFDIESPLLSPEEIKEPKKTVKLPKIVFTIESGLLNYHDQSLKTPFTTELAIPYLQINIKNSSDLNFQLAMKRENDQLKAEGKYDLQHGSGTVDLEGNSTDLQKWSNLIADPNLSWEKGNFNFKFTGEWSDPKLKDLKFRANLEANNVYLKTEHYLKTINLEKFSGEIDQNYLKIREINLSTPESRLKINGEGNYNGNKPFFQLNISSDRLRIDSELANISPELISEETKKIALKGLAAFNLKINGLFKPINRKTFLAYPENLILEKISGKIALKDISVYGMKVVQSLETNLELDQKDLKLKKISSNLFSGNLAGELTVKNIFLDKFGTFDPKNSVINGKTQISRLRLNEIMDQLAIPVKYLPIGSLSGEINIFGKIFKPQIQASFYSKRIYFSRHLPKIAPINDLKLLFQGNNDIYRLKADLKSEDFGKTSFSLENKDNNIFTTKINSKSIKASIIKLFDPNIIFITPGYSDLALKLDIPRDFIYGNKKYSNQELLKKSRINLNLKSEKVFLASEKAKREPFLKINQAEINLLGNSGNFSGQLETDTEEYGKTNVELKIKDGLFASVFLKVKEIPLSSFQKNIDGLAELSGDGDLEINLKTEIKNLAKINQTNFYRLIELSSKLNIFTTKLVYQDNNRRIALSDLNGKFNFALDKESIKSFFKIEANEIKSFSGEFSTPKMKEAVLAFKAEKIMLEKFAELIPKLSLKNGEGNFYFTAKANLAKFLPNYDWKNFQKSSQGKGIFSFENVDLKYQTDSKIISLAEFSGELKTDFFSDYILPELIISSSEIGKITAKGQIKNLSQVDFSLKSWDFPLANLEKIVPTLKVKQGITEIEANFSGNIQKILLAKDLSEISRLINGKGIIGINNGALVYQKGKKEFFLNELRSTLNFNFLNGLIYSDLSIFSQEFGESFAELELKNLDNLKIKLASTKIEPEVFSFLFPNLYWEKGTTDLNLNLKTRLSLLSTVKNLNELKNSFTGNGEIILSESNLSFLKPEDKINLGLSSGKFNFTLREKKLLANIELSTEKNSKSLFRLEINKNGETLLAGKIENLATKIIETIIPDLKITRGFANLDLDWQTNISEFYQETEFIQLMKISSGKANILLKETYWQFQENLFNKTEGNIDLQLKDGEIKANTTLESQELEKLTASIKINNLDATEVFFKAEKINVPSFSGIIPDFSAKQGQGDFEGLINFKLSTIKQESWQKLFKSINCQIKANFNNLSFSYAPFTRSGLNLNESFASLSLQSKNGLVDANFSLGSKELGESQGFLKITPEGKMDLKIASEEIQLKNLNGLFPDLAISEGKANFALVAGGNFQNLFKDKKAITAKGKLIISDLDANYYREQEILPVDLKESSFNISYLDEIFIAEGKINSNEFGNLNTKIKINNDGWFNGDLSSEKIELWKLSKFLENKDLSLDSGVGKLKLIVRGSLAKIRKSPYNFFASGFTTIDNLNLETEDKTLSQNKKSNRINLNFRWNNGTIMIDQLVLNNDYSQISGDGYYRLGKNESEEKGKINLNSEYFDLENFPLAVYLGIKKGEINDLKLTARLTDNLKNSKFYLNGEVNNLYFERQNAKIDNFATFIKMEKQKIYIDKFKFSEKDSFFSIFGSIDLNESDNPKFTLNNLSRHFPIQSLFALFPESFLREIYDGNENANKEVNKKTANYFLPYRDLLKINISENQDLNALINYWNKWSLEPLTEEETRKTYEVKKFWQAISGKLSTDIRLKGTIKDPYAEARLIITDSIFYERELNEIYLNFLYDQGDFNLNDFHLWENNGGIFKIDGKMTKNGLLDFSGEGRINLNWLESFVNEKYLTVDGDLDIDLEVSGNMTKPQGAISFEAKDGVINDIYFDKLLILANLNNDLINLAEATFISGGKEAKISGDIPLSNTGRLDLSTRLDGKSLGLINLFSGDSFEWIKGDGDAFLNVSGTLSNPLLKGNVDIRDAQIFVDSLDNNLEKFNLDLDINNYFVKIEKADAFFNGSPISLFGQVDLIGFRPGFLKLKFSSDNFSWKENNLAVNGKVDLRITNTVSEPLIGGKIKINDGRFQIKIGSSESASDTTMVSENKSENPGSRQIGYNNLKIEIPEKSNFWVSSPFFSLRPSGNINLKRGLLKEPEIEGFMGIDEGELFILNNEFKVIKATADFSGKDFEKELYPINPSLNFIADTKLFNTRTNSKVDVEAQIKGEMSDIPENKMNINWTKTGGLTEAEIWEQVIGIQGAKEVASDPAKLAEFATPYFNRAIFNPLTNKVAEFFDLEEFSVGLATDTLSNPGVVFSLSKPIFKDFFLGYRGVFRSVSFAEYDIFARYQLFSNINLRYNFDEQMTHTLQGEAGFNF